MYKRQNKASDRVGSDIRDECNEKFKASKKTFLENITEDKTTRRTMDKINVIYGGEKTTIKGMSSGSTITKSIVNEIISYSGMLLDKDTTAVGIDEIVKKGVTWIGNEYRTGGWHPLGAYVKIGLLGSSLAIRIKQDKNDSSNIKAKKKDMTLIKNFKNCLDKKKKLSEEIVISEITFSDIRPGGRLSDELLGPFKAFCKSDKAYENLAFVLASSTCDHLGVTQERPLSVEERNYLYHKYIKHGSEFPINIHYSVRDKYNPVREIDPVNPNWDSGLTLLPAINGTLTTMNDTVNKFRPTLR